MIDHNGYQQRLNRVRHLIVHPADLLQDGERVQIGIRPLRHRHVRLRDAETFLREQEAKQSP